LKFIELIRLDDPWKRAFYENECLKGNWSVRQLQRQIGSLLYERTALSTDKQAVEAPSLIADLIRDPYILEFTGLAQKAHYPEKELETALLDHLQSFLLELSTGFCFEARQRRITIGNEHDYIDLVVKLWRVVVEESSGKIHAVGTLHHRHFDSLKPLQNPNDLGPPLSHPPSHPRTRAMNSAKSVQTVTGRPPYDDQKRLACGEKSEGETEPEWLVHGSSPEPRNVSTATRPGKTAAVVLAILHRTISGRDKEVSILAARRLRASGQARLADELPGAGPLARRTEAAKLLPVQHRNFRRLEAVVLLPFDPSETARIFGNERPVIPA